MPAQKRSYDNASNTTPTAEVEAVDDDDTVQREQSNNHGQKTQDSSAPPAVDVDGNGTYFVIIIIFSGAKAENLCVIVISLYVLFVCISLSGFDCCFRFFFLCRI